jgi:hypothetical protein
MVHLIAKNLERLTMKLDQLLAAITIELQAYRLRLVGSSA